MTIGLLVGKRQLLKTMANEVNIKANNMANKVSKARWKKAELTYCANVHACTQLSQLADNLNKYFSPVRNERSLAAMFSGLWLSNDVAVEITADKNKLAYFKDTLKEHGVSLTSLNGFPYGDFHAPVVKENVYLPDWADNRRLSYTKKLADILASCLPDNIACGAISTLPLGYKKIWQVEKSQQAVKQLIALVHYLILLEEKTGKQIQIGLEMEPDCVLEFTDELVSFFDELLIPEAILEGISRQQLLRYIACCYDTCHQAVMFENTKDALTKITQANIQICKIQISNALACQLSTQEEVNELCRLFNDPKFMHQCSLQGESLIKLDDLNQQALGNVFQRFIDSRESEALVVSSLLSASKKISLACRVHYHVPIHLQDISSSFISTTQDAILSTLDFLQNNPQLKPYIEIETYTWLHFLSQASSDKPTLVDGLLAEFTWLEQAMKTRNLLD